VNDPDLARAPTGDGDEPLAQVTRILAIRHGETDWNAQQRLQGHADVPLNALGLAQAQRLVQALQAEPVRAIYSSDLSRASQTALPAAQALGLPIRLDPGLRERCFGAFEGHTYAQIESLWPADAQAWRRRDPEFAAPGGESLTAFHGRCVGAVLNVAAAHAGQTIVVVAHGGVLDALYRSASRAGPQAPRTWQLSNAAINRLLVTDEGLMLVGWNDCQHLEGL
jgi:probable phosphoglycerate mutase